MQLEHKKKVLTLIIEGLEKESIVQELISLAWSLETKPDSIPLSNQVLSKKKGKSRRGTPVLIHGIEYSSLNFACRKVWGLTDPEYKKIYKEYKSGVALEDLLQPRTDATKVRMDTDIYGVVRVGGEA